MLEILEKILLTTYTICLPLIIGWLTTSHKEKKKALKEMADSTTAITTAINALTERLDMNEAMTSRYRIIRAADEIQNGEKLSTDHVEQLDEDMDIYDSYCDRHPDYKNHKGRNSRRIVMDYEKILTGGEKHEQN